MNKASKINTPPIPIFRKLMDTTPNVTRADLAEYLGVSAVAIGQYYNGDALPSMDNLIKISKYFNVSTDYLLGLTDVKTTDTDLKAICEFTGLDPRAVEVLHLARPLRYFSMCIYDILINSNMFDLLAKYISTESISRFIQLKYFDLFRDNEFNPERCAKEPMYNPYTASKFSEEELTDPNLNPFVGTDKKLYPYIYAYKAELDDNLNYLKFKAVSTAYAILNNVSVRYNTECGDYPTPDYAKNVIEKKLKEFEELNEEHHKRSGGNGKHTREKK